MAIYRSKRDGFVVLIFKNSFAVLGDYKTSGAVGMTEYMDSKPYYTKVGPGILTQWSKE